MNHATVATTLSCLLALAVPAGSRAAPETDACPEAVLAALKPACDGLVPACFRAVAVPTVGPPRGWLALARCGEGATELAWVAAGGSGPRVGWPLRGRTRGEYPWDFLDVESVGDLDGDGAIEALLSGTGGAGMYFHYPIVLRLGAAGRWTVLLRTRTPYFYGSTEPLPPRPDRRLRLAVTSVDEKTPWAFCTASLAPHPYKRETFLLARGGLRLLRREPVPGRLRAVSDLVLAARRHRAVAAFALLATGATVGGEPVRDAPSARAALDRLGLARTLGECQEQREEAGVRVETVQGRGVAVLGGPAHTPGDTIRFACFHRDGATRSYRAVVVERDGGFGVRSIEAALPAAQTTE